MDSNAHHFEIWHLSCYFWTHKRMHNYIYILHVFVLLINTPFHTPFSPNTLTEKNTYFSTLYFRLIWYSGLVKFEILLCFKHTNMYCVVHDIIRFTLCYHFFFLIFTKSYIVYTETNPFCFFSFIHTCLDCSTTIIFVKRKFISVQCFAENASIICIDFYIF